MRFLVDESLSWKVAKALTDAGHDALHAYDLELGGTEDSAVLAVAAKQNRILVAEDTDFSALLVLQSLTFPSLILFRMRSTDPSDQTRSLLRVLPALEPSLLIGAIVVMCDAFIRVRRLPIGSEEEKN